tara:strand:+ start:836 stop:1120 length:285 start_codon:yes stop_codon:yes gene_type:complete
MKAQNLTTIDTDNSKWEEQLLNKLKNLEWNGSGFYVEWVDEHSFCRLEHISLVCDPYPVICINGGTDGEEENNGEGYKRIKELLIELMTLKENK